LNLVKPNKEREGFMPTLKQDVRFKSEMGSKTEKAKEDVVRV